MRHRIALATLTTLFFAAPAFAMSSGEPRRDPPPSSADVRTPPTPRQQADRLYADAYDEVAKGNRELAQQKQKNAGKKFQKALSRAEEAAGLDTTYHEAWNLVGYCARRLKDYDKSLAAYARCLRLKPDYSAAREYLGEAYVDLGQFDQAREQLAWLERLKDEEAVEALRGHIETAEKAAGASATPAPADSTTAGGAVPDSAKTP